MTTRTLLIFSSFLLITVLGVALTLESAHSEEEPAKGATNAKPFVQVARGEAALKEDRKHAIEVKLGQGNQGPGSEGKGIHGTGKISITDWFGAKAVSGQVDIENTSDVKRYTSVSLILFDKDGNPLGCAAQSMDADPKEKTIWGGFVIKLPSEQLKQVRAYAYLWYEDDKPIGMR